MRVLTCLFAGHQESSSEGLLSSVGRGVEKGSLQKHPSSSRKLGRQEGDGTLGVVSGSLVLTSGKSKLKDKLSAIRQDRAERRESLQKQDAIHEVDSSEDETDEGSEDSQDGRRGTVFTPPPLLRPTTVRTGPGGTLPSLCLSPCSSHATFTHTGPSQVGRPAPSHSLPPVAEMKPSQTASSAGVRDGHLASSTEEDVRQERKLLEPSRATKTLPFSTPGSAFISVSKDTFLMPAPPQDSKSLKGKPGPSEPRAEGQAPASPRPTPPCSERSAGSGCRSAPIPSDSKISTSAADCRAAEETASSSCSSPGIPKEKKEADNRRLCAAAAGLSASPSPSSNPSSGFPVPPAESGVDRVVSQLATVAKSVLGPVKLNTKEQKSSRGGTPDLPAADPVSRQVTTPQSPQLSPNRQKTQSAALPTAAHVRPTTLSTQRDGPASQPPPCTDVPERQVSELASRVCTATSAFAQRLGTAAGLQPVSAAPPPPAAAEPQRKRPDSRAAAAAAQQDKANSRKT